MGRNRRVRDPSETQLAAGVRIGRCHSRMTSRPESYVHAVNALLELIIDVPLISTCKPKQQNEITAGELPRHSNPTTANWFGFSQWGSTARGEPCASCTTGIRCAFPSLHTAEGLSCLSGPVHLSRNIHPLGGRDCPRTDRSPLINLKNPTLKFCFTRPRNRSNGGA